MSYPEYRERNDTYRQNDARARSQPEYYYTHGNQFQTPRRRQLPHERRYDIERDPDEQRRDAQDQFSQQRHIPFNDPYGQQHVSDRPYSQQIHDPYNAYSQQQLREPAYKNMGEDYESHPKYDTVKPAGRANSYSAKITDLLTSIKEPPTIDSHKIIEVNKGYLAFVRCTPSDMTDFITAIQKNVSIIRSHTGTVLGFAQKHDISIMLGDRWRTKAQSQQWSDARGESQYAVCVMWFRDVYACKRFFETREMVHADMPYSNRIQILTVPLTFGKNQEPFSFVPEGGQGPTLLLTEFTHIYERYPNDFRDNFSDPARDQMKHYGAHPNISICKYQAGWPPEANKFGQASYDRREQQHERMARSIKQSWVSDGSFISVSTFPSMEAVEAYHRDEYTRQLHARLTRYAKVASVAINLKLVSGIS